MKICEIVLERKCTDVNGGTETRSWCEMNWIILKIVINLSLKHNIFGGPRRLPKDGKEGKKEKLKSLSVFADLNNMLHASFGFNIHAEAKGCFCKTRSHTPQM